MFNKLYVRIWLAVVLAVAVLTLLVGWAWRLAAEPPLRDLVVRDEAGQIIGRGLPRGMIPDRAAPSDERKLRQRGRDFNHNLDRDLDLARSKSPSVAETSQAANVAASVPGAADEDASANNDRPPVPEFMVRMHNGQTMNMRFMRAPPSVWNRAPFGFAWMLVWVGIAVALATYPIVRKLTRRLERLQDGVQRWGEGDLTTRVSESGTDEVAFLARRFNQAAERVQTLVQSHESLLASQKSLLANASHELRSPLARIRMGLELLGPSASPAFKAEIARNIAELDQLIEEILLASRLDARESDLGTVESVDLMGLAAEECARVDADLQWMDSNGRELIEPQLDLAVPGVAKLLRRAVRNLLENARRYAAGNIALTLVADTKWVEVRVCDRGPGVPNELRTRIFEPFYRLPGATERDGGVGLGLALVKSIAQRHGGRVFCENREGGGSCFVIQLPKT